MAKSVNYTLELKPGLMAPDGTLDRSGGCTQDCPHCVFSESRVVPGVRSVSKEMAETLQLTQFAIRQACLAHQDTFGTLNVTSGYPNLGAPPLFQGYQALPDFSPDYLSFGFGDLSRIPRTDLEDGNLPNRLASYAPFQFQRKPKLRVDYRLPLRDLTSSEENLGKALALGINLIMATQGPDYAFNPHALAYSETVNAYPKPADLIDPGKVKARYKQIQALIGDLFEDPTEADSIVEPKPSNHVFYLDHIVQHSAGVFVYLNRIIPRKKTDEQASLTGVNSEAISISFFPDFVWINHTTYSTNDLTVRFSYDEYFQILKKSQGRGRKLKALLENEILKRRT